MQKNTLSSFKVRRIASEILDSGRETAPVLQKDGSRIMPIDDVEILPGYSEPWELVVNYEKMLEGVFDEIFGRVQTIQPELSPEETK